MRAALRLTAGVAQAALICATCHVPGWEVHDDFDATCGRTHAKQTTTKTCEDCLKAAVAANHSVYSWNHGSHHCFTASCAPKFEGASNPRVQSGCRTELPGCTAPTPGPPGPPPPPPSPPPGPARFVAVEAGTFTMGRACANCPAGMVSDDPKLTLADGYLSYDEQPPRSVAVEGFSMMTQTVSAGDFKQSGLPGSSSDVSHNTAVAFAEWYTTQQKDSSVYRLPTEAEWERARKAGNAALEFSGREHVHDWHGVYPNPGPPTPTAGPSTGILRVVRDGRSEALATTRYSVAPDATSLSSAVASPTMHEGIPPTSFRLVKVAASSAAATPAHTNAPLPQVAVLPDGTVQTAGGGEVDVSTMGPPADKPWFKVRMVMPMPPDSETEGSASLTGLDPATMWHNHSPGFEALPNGDILAVWFSSSVGPKTGEAGSESTINSRMVQARLRHGADRWDAPELFYDWKYMNDQSALLWTEGSKVWFWGGGGGQLQFKVAVSSDSGANWALHLPNITNKIAPTVLATQPITTAFRGVDGGLFMGVDSKGASSGLWKSMDNGSSWADQHGRTVGRHTTFFTTKARDKIMAFGGKNSNIDGYMPFTFSTDGGKTFAAGAKLPFPALGGNQRPCVHRLLSGNLVFVGDYQVKGSGTQPAGFKPKVGETSGVYAALSADDGKTWVMKPLPIALPHETDLKNFGTLGYSTVRQGPNGVIHILSTMTHPCLHYEINEAWFHAANDGNDDNANGRTTTTNAAAAAAAAASVGAPVAAHAMTASGGNASWSYIVDPVAGYLLDGTFATTTIDDLGHAVPEYTATYSRGVRTSETLHRRTRVGDGGGGGGSAAGIEWSWQHQANGSSVFEKFDDTGRLRVHSEWENKPVGRDYHLIKSNPPGFRFIGLSAEGNACIYSASGGIVAANVFKAGALETSAKASC